MADENSIRDLLSDAAQRGINYRDTIADRAVEPSAEAIAGARNFLEPMPEKGMDDRQVLEMLDNTGPPATITMAGPRYFGFVIGGSLPVTVATNWLTTAWDQNVGMHEVTPATSTLERVAMNWMIDLFGLPKDSAAAFVTGATGRCVRRSISRGASTSAAFRLSMGHRRPQMVERALRQWHSVCS